MVALLRNSTGTDVNASRDDRTLTPITQLIASREYRKLAPGRPDTCKNGHTLDFVLRRNHHQNKQG